MKTATAVGIAVAITKSMATEKTGTELVEKLTEKLNRHSAELSRDRNSSCMSEEKKAAEQMLYWACRVYIETFAVKVGVAR